MRRARRHLERAASSVFTRASVALIAALALAAPGIAWAQDNAPPQPNLKRYPPVWIGFLLMVVLLGAVVAVSLFPSKRGHQD